ncbi:MAG: Vitamin B12 dependent methionine synthase activation subunit [Thermincola sp.]|jgi:hypothetical protein|nr:Vitamin B12 dependent methionine synthase activation subunit [Thermincola sp.]MDT3703296.1 Vitamin B12 dependent methionine synthase activation subunit [Thermincola sp.]
MNEPVVWELKLPEITIEDVFQAEGADYSKRQPRPNIIALHREIMEEAKGLVRPTAIWCEAAVGKIGEQEVILADGQKLASRLLAKAARTAEKFILFTMTIGNAMDDRAAEYHKAGKVMETFIIDAVGTAYITKSALAALERINELCHSNGLETTFPMGPGHSYWSEMGDMKTIFNILRPERVNLKLTESNLMIPRKSVAMVLGVGRKLPDLMEKSHCDFCDLNDSCKMRSDSGPIC